MFKHRDLGRHGYSNKRSPQGCITTPGSPQALKLISPKQLLFYCDCITLLSDGKLVSPYLVLDILGL